MSSKSRRDKSGAGKSSRTSKRANRSKSRAPQTNAVNVVTVSAASYEATAVAPDSIVAAFGTSLATSTQAASTVPLPTTLAGTSVTLRDTAAVERLAPLIFVSPNLINYLVPPDTATGAATVTVVAGNGIISQGTMQVQTAAPATFTANADGKGVPAANLIRVRGGQQINESLVQLDPATGRLKPKPIDPGPEGDRLFLVLYLSGLRRAPDPNGDGNLNENVRVIIGSLEVTPDFAGRQPTFVGLDQVNAEIPRSLAGRGRLDVVVTVPAFNSSNVVEIDFGPAAGIAPPQITGFSAATATAGQTITINGSGFSSTPAENLVRIGGLEATVVSASPNQLSVITPFGAESDKVTVRTPQGEGASANALSIRTSISGYVETTSRQPLAGVTVKVTGTNIAATTNAEGAFILPDAPTGAREIEVDGGTVQIASSYPKIKLRTNAVANRDNQLLHPISLQFAAGASVPFSATGNLTDEAITVPAARSESDPALIPVETGNVIFEIPSGTTVTFPDGSTSGALALSQLEGSRTPVNLPKGHFSSSILQIAPYGASFSQGCKITFPNRDGLPAEAQVKLFRLDQTAGSATLGSFVEAGLATVSADGKTVETQAGVITESGSYFVSALRPALTLIGRVVESQGSPVRRVFVIVRGQETITDGNGGFVLRLVPANQGDRVRVDASYLRGSGRVEHVTRDFGIPVTILPVGFVRVTPDLVLPADNSNRPPVILAPTSLSVAAGQTLEVNVAVSDQDSGQTVQVTVSGASFATLSSQGGGAYKLRLAPGSSDAGAYTLTLTATDSANASATQNISLSVNAPPPVIADFSPKNGKVGTVVTFTGASLKSAFGNPSVTFAGAGGTRLEAFVSSATATEVRVTVPNGAVTGRIELANTLGRALTGSPFTV
ncbi:MAG: IPT/TIG domain-containing protein, partial [Blastocatellia bacterium]